MELKKKERGGLASKEGKWRRELLYEGRNEGGGGGRRKE